MLRTPLASYRTVLVLFAVAAVPAWSGPVDPENMEPKYSVRVYADSASAGVSGSARLVPMTGRGGRKFTCAIPHAAPAGADGGPSSASSSSSAGASAGAGSGAAAAKAPAVRDHLKMLEKMCFFKLDGWWSFELCMFSTMRQFHQDGKETTADYSLGRFDAAQQLAGEDATRPTGIDPGSGRPYFSFFLQGGTECDLTGKLRKSEVRVMCSADGSNSIGAISEPATCAYTIIFSTPAICSHPAFKTESAPEHVIACWPRAVSQKSGHSSVPPDSPSAADPAAATSAAAGTGDDVKGEL